MKKLLLAIAIALLPLQALAGIVTITASGFSTLSATAPEGWPSNVTWPGGGSPNGTKTFTISDAAWVQLLTWTAASQTSLQGTVAVPSTPSAAQVLLAWVMIWANGTVAAVQSYFTTPPTVPAPITIQ